MNVTLITDLGRLDKAIRMIAKRGEKLDTMIHVAALSAALAVEEHGNIHYVNALYKACPRGARHSALTLWLTTFAGVSANTGKEKAEKPFVFDKAKEVDIEGGMQEPWYTLKPSPEPDAVLDVRKLLAAVLKKARNPKEGQTVVNYNLVASVESILAGETVATPVVSTDEEELEDPETDDEVLAHIA